ncbi:MAG: nuclear transport factor 2 family protein [Actinomycetota bacterium]|nr:nuclear transport factor 2 family protein [Actinomycetota bacterium]
MTDANALVQAIVDALNRGDWDGLLDRAAPEFEYDLTRTDSPLRGVHSRAQMPRVLDEFLGSWESVRYEPHEVIERGDRLVIPFTTHFRGRDGIEMHSEAVWVWTLRAGALVRVVLFQDRAEALAAAGGAG